MWGTSSRGSGSGTTTQGRTAGSSDRSGHRRQRDRRVLGGAIDVEAVIAIGVAAETSAEANEMSRWPVPPTAQRGPAAGLILWTLEDHRRFELIACCTACERYVVLEHAALAARFGWDAPLDVLRRRMTCRHRGARTGSVVISQAR